MYNVSQAFLDALRAPHRMGTKVEVLDAGEPVVELAVLDGSVVVDGSAEIRRRCSVELTDPAGELTPASAADLLAPYGNELRVWRGVWITTNSGGQLTESLELAPLGVFGISDVDVEDGLDGLRIKLTGFDRARRVQLARYTQTYVVAAATNYATAIQNLVSGRVPGTEFNFMVTTRTTPRLVFGEDTDSDPWADAQRMARSIGAELFFDAEGVCVLRPEPNALTAPVTFYYEEGEEATLTALSKSMSDEGVYNHWVVSGESSTGGVPVRGEAVDDDASSPTYYLGDFGDRPTFIVSPFVTTVAQAEDAAEAAKLRGSGESEKIAFRHGPNPAHDAGDVVQMTRERSRVDARYVIDTLTVPLAADAEADGTCRKRLL